MSDLAARARADAEAARKAETAYVRAPSDAEERVAYIAGRILGVKVDPKDAYDVKTGHPYYVAEVQVHGLTFHQKFMRDTNGLHAIAVGPTVSRKVRRPWWKGGGYRTEVRGDVNRIGDLDGMLD